MGSVSSSCEQKELTLILDPVRSELNERRPGRLLVLIERSEVLAVPVGDPVAATSGIDRSQRWNERQARTKAKKRTSRGGSFRFRSWRR